MMYVRSQCVSLPDIPVSLLQGPPPDSKLLFPKYVLSVVFNISQSYLMSNTPCAPVHVLRPCMYVLRPYPLYVCMCSSFHTRRIDVYTGISGRDTHCDRTYIIRTYTRGPAYDTTYTATNQLICIRILIRLRIWIPVPSSFDNNRPYIRSTYIVYIQYTVVGEQHRHFQVKSCVTLNYHTVHSSTIHTHRAVTQYHPHHHGPLRPSLPSPKPSHPYHQLFQPQVQKPLAKSFARCFYWWEEG